MHGVLTGVRVLDFGRYIAGPFCAALLAEFGASVIRIEKRSGGEDRDPAPLGESGASGLYLQMNRNKRGMTLDPMTPGGQAVLTRLVKSADVVVANLPPPTLKAMKLDYDSLRAVRPDIILTALSAFGPTGPYADRVGFDGVGQVMSGAAYLSADSDESRPVRLQAPWVDYGTALSAAYGTALAILHRERTGEGQLVQGALLHTALMMMSAFLTEQAVVAANRKPSGNRGQTSAPVDIFRTRDGWILVQVGGQPLFVRWAKLMQEDSWLTDPRFKDDTARGENAAIVNERMSRWCAERSSADALEALARAKVPAAPVLSPQQALDDPHVQAMGILSFADYPGLPRPAPLFAAPVSLSRHVAPAPTRAPLLGEHTDEILRELDFDAAEIAELREARAI